MDLVWYSLFVLLITGLILYLPVLVIILAHQIYQVFINKSKIFAWIFYFIFGYLLISLVGVGIYYYFSDFDKALSTTAIRTDIVYIFTACAALCAPILVLVTLNLWRKQYRTSLNKELIINLVTEIEELRQVLLETYELLKSIYSNHQRNWAILVSEQKKPNNEDQVNKVIQDIKSGYYLQVKQLLEGNTFRIFEKKCGVFKYATILRMGTNLLDDEPEEIEKITIRASKIIHAIHSKAVNCNQALSQEDLDNYYECLIDLKKNVENIVYPKLKQDLYLIENPL
ncbi:hypothetical protein AAV96_02125 [Acinetobacter sp. AG1]|uniref:hypothetical protein n=1 Tax=Acinetobacter TaxID=469 RepID=UPI000629C5CF|nr:hypothetical protein [Acinetobacter sp. AG1]KKW82014.1 hypothetical protein AAV96_02125 [Acinetobacter sp. AG1]